MFLWHSTGCIVFQGLMRRNVPGAWCSECTVFRGHKCCLQHPALSLGVQLLFFFEFLMLKVSLSVLRRTLENRRSIYVQKVHLCTVRVHPEAEHNRTGITCVDASDNSAGRLPHPTGIDLCTGIWCVLLSVQKT